MVKMFFLGFLFLIVFTFINGAIVPVPQENAIKMHISDRFPVHDDLSHKFGAMFARKLVLEKIKGQNQQVFGVNLRFFNWREVVCKECKMAADYLYAYVSDPNLQKHVQEYVDEMVCQKLGPYKQMCEKVMAAEIPYLFEELEDLFGDNTTFCQQVRLCAVDGMAMANVGQMPAFMNNIANSKNDELYQQIGALFIEKMLGEKMRMTGALASKTTNNGVICAECKKAVHAMYGFANSSTAQKQVLDLIDEMFCSKLGPYRKMCKIVVASEMRQFWAKIQAQLADNEAFCQRIHLCPNNSAKAATMEKDSTNEANANANALNGHYNRAMGQPTK